jgi:transglutaminase-like putative cysteine protease
LVRILVVAIGCAILFSASFFSAQRQPAVVKIANGMLGETWYRIQLSSDHVGFMYNNAFTDYFGRWHFTTTTHFQLQDNAPTTITKHLVFDAQPPYPLLQASYNNRQDERHYNTEVEQSSTGYIAHLDRTGTGNKVELDWQFDLATFVSFEHWLATTRPQANAEQVVKSPDFERLRITQRSYRVVAANEQGYLVETNAPLAATQTQLDHQFRPIRLNMAGIFDVTATDEADAISLKQLNRKTNYLFTVDQRLDDHTTLAGLHLRLHSAPEFDLPDELRLSANPIVTKGNGTEHSGEEMRYPITHPSIQTLVQKSFTSAQKESRIAQLVHATNQQLRYAEDKPAGSVLLALNRGQGECTDYADLFTTLARAAGYPARNIYGLAYKDGPTPAFMFHAWNEVYSDGRWQAVDPTWNQTTVDATHIPLTDEQAAIMMLANNTSEVSFSVLGTQYF